MTINLPYNKLSSFPNLNGVTVSFMSLHDTGCWLDVYDGGDKNNFPKVTQVNEGDLFSQAWTKWIVVLKDGAYYLKSVRWLPTEYYMTAGSGSVKQDIKGAGDDHTSSPIWNNEQNPWGKPEAQWEFVCLDDQKSYYRLKNKKFGDFLDSYDDRMVQHSNAQTDKTSWFVYSPFADDEYIQVAQYYNSDVDTTWHPEIMVGISQQNGQTTTQTVAAEAGCEFKGCSAKLSYSQEWQTTSSVTYSVEVSQQWDIALKHNEGCKLLQLTGKYGGFNIRSTSNKTEPWDGK